MVNCAYRVSSAFSIVIAFWISVISLLRRWQAVPARRVLQTFNSKTTVETNNAIYTDYQYRIVLVSAQAAYHVLIR